MNVLIIGAGAVGKVYGRHLQLGGAAVSFLVKPQRVEESARGFDLYPLNRGHPRRQPVSSKAPIFGSIEEAMATRPDAVVLCVSSAALRTGDWLTRVADRLGDASLVALQPAPADLAFVRERAPPDQVVAGLIAIVSYAGPLAGENLPRPGTVYWFPPLSKSAFSGPRERAERLVDTFRRGGLPAKLVPDAAALQAFGAAVLQPVVIALEIAGWRIDDLRRDRDLLRLTYAATREAVEVISRSESARPPFSLRMIRPAFLRLGLGMGKRVAPLDLEAYLRVHFTKVGDQTRLWIDDIGAAAAAETLPHGAIGELDERLRRISSPPARAD